MKSHSLKIGDELTVVAERLNDDGDGVARNDGLTIFVPHLLPTETANVVITQVEKRFARARVASRQETASKGAAGQGATGQGASSLREQPACSVFGACGGCQLQHIDYQAQLAHKRDVIESTLRRHAKLPDVPVLPTLGMQHPWRYRNQVQVPIRFDERSGRFIGGFFAPASHNLVPTDECHLEPVAMERTVVAVLELLSGAQTKRSVAADGHVSDVPVQVPVYAHVHHIIVRQSFTTGQLMVILAVRRPLQGASELALVEQIAALPDVVSVAQTVQPQAHGPVWGSTVTVLAGAPHLTERVEGLEFLISPRSFFQVNTEQAGQLYQQVLRYADLRPTDQVLDAYSGTGTISLLLAEHAKRVLGVENIRPAVEDAKRNAQHNRVTNARFVVGEVEQVVPERLAKGEQFDVVVLDPPRRGCHPDVLHAITSAKPRRIVYVSCNHATLARDLGSLVAGGYKVEEAQPVDMFPQTSHVETCLLLVRDPV